MLYHLISIRLSIKLRYYRDDDDDDDDDDEVLVHAGRLRPKAEGR